MHTTAVALLHVSVYVIYCLKDILLFWVLWVWSVYEPFIHRHHVSEGDLL